MSCINRPSRLAVFAGAVAIASALFGCASGPTTESATMVTEGGSYAAEAERELASFQAALGSMNRNELDEAAGRFRSIAKSRPDLAGPWANLALIDIRRNQLDQAEKNAAEALKRNPRLAQAHGVLGYVAAARGDVRKALEHYRRAVDIKKDYAVAHYNIAVINDLFLNDMAAAAAHYRLYLAATAGGDKKTADWLAEIERGLGQQK